MDKNFKWMDEKIDSLPSANWLYKLCCFFLNCRKKKLSYKEFYLILRKLNEKQLGLEESSRFAFQRIIEIYKFQNGKMPDLNGGL